MNIFAQIVTNAYPPDLPATAYPAGSDIPVNAGLISSAVTGSISGEVYICIYDTVTGQLANGNNVLVSYQEVINGIIGPVKQVNVPGQSTRIYKGLLQQFSGDGSFNYTAIILGIADGGTIAPDTSPVPSGGDVVITTVNIDKPESDYGAADGEVTIVANSSHLPLQYSLDGVSYQSSPAFTHLAAGGYIAYVTDAAGYAATCSFNLTATHQLLVADPSVDLGNGNISRWNAAFNPIVFTYQRKDAGLLKMEQHSTGKTIITLNADVSPLRLDDLIYLNAGPYTSTYQVAKESSGIYNQLVIELTYQPDMAAITGYMNSNRLRPYYKVCTKITYQDKISSRQQNIVSTNRPDATGLVKADLSSFLQSLLRAKDESNFSQINYRDDNLSASYTIAYAEVWDNHNDNEDSRIYTTIGTPYYVTFAARQLGDLYGGNMAAFVPFKSVIVPQQLARWVTDFAEPAYSEGYPFDIGFIYGEDLAGLDIYCEITQLDINRQPLPGGPKTTFLLNEDGSFLLNTDGGKLIISRQTTGTTALAQHIGLNRLLISGGFAPQAAYFTLTLKYLIEGAAHRVTQTQVVRIDDAVDDQSVYLRWIGLTGSWNYYRFVYNQEVTLDVQNATIIKRYVTDWQNQDGIEDVLSKSAGQKMKVMAEDLSVADIKGLQALKYSPKVQMLINRNPVKWQTVVLNTATFSEYETRNGQAPFSVTFNLPSINIQEQ